MKLLSYNLHSPGSEKLQEINPKHAKIVADAIFAEGYDRILSKWKDNLVLLEAIPNYNPDKHISRYSQTRIQYHPLEDLL